MSAERRLARLEGALSPHAATLVWLEEAHRFPTLSAYVGWLLDQPEEAAPFWRVPEQAETAVRQAMRGAPREAIQRAARQAVRDAIFLVELVIRLNFAAEEGIRFEGLRYAALFWERRALAAEAELETGSEGPQGRRTIARRRAAWREAVSGWLTNLYAAEEARLLLERCYLDGRSVLFPDLGRDWDALRETAERLAAPGDSLTVLRDRASRRRGQPVLNLGALRTAARARVAAEAAYLADTARAAALDLLGDAEGAVAIAERRRRSRER